MNDLNVTPVILCGGSGLRLWPISRKDRPKQFIALSGEQTLFEATLKRVNSAEFSTPLVFANEEHRFLVAQTLAASGLSGEIILETEAKSTALPFVLSAVFLKSIGSDDLILFLPSDHVFGDVGEFLNLIKLGRPAALQNKLVTFGVQPTAAETGFGYIGTGDRCNDGALEVKEFIEKPDKVVAEKLLSDGSYLWNSGVYLTSIDNVIDIAKSFEPDIYELCVDIVASFSRDGFFLRPDSLIWKKSKNGSIDYLFSEKISNISCVKFDGLWSDLGDWKAVFKQMPLTENSNVEAGAVTTMRCENSSLWSTDQRLHVAGLGLKDVLVVATRDAVLVASKSELSNLKNLIEEMLVKGVPQGGASNVNYRPWGTFESLELEDGYQVKRLEIKPRYRLSLQSHEFRSEHWVVVRGKATVTLGDWDRDYDENESVYIDAGQKHRLANNTDQPLIVIEVQTGPYLGEDDIKRYSDDFDRVQALVLDQES